MVKAASILLSGSGQLGSLRSNAGGRDGKHSEHDDLMRNRGLPQSVFRRQLCVSNRHCRDVVRKSHMPRQRLRKVETGWLLAITLMPHAVCAALRLRRAGLIADR